MSKLQRILCAVEAAIDAYQTGVGTVKIRAITSGG